MLKQVLIQLLCSERGNITVPMIERLSIMIGTGLLAIGMIDVFRGDGAVKTSTGEVATYLAANFGRDVGATVSVSYAGVNKTGTVTTSSVTSTGFKIATPGVSAITNERISLATLGVPAILSRR